MSIRAQPPQHTPPSSRSSIDERIQQLREERERRALNSASATASDVVKRVVKDAWQSAGDHLTAARRAISPPNGASPSVSVRPGQKVQAKWKDWDKWYNATVTSLNADGTLGVLYADGFRWLACPRDKVRLPGALTPLSNTTTTGRAAASSTTSSSSR